MAFSELNDSPGSFSYITPSSDLDRDDATLGKLLSEAYRGQADYCEPGGVSVCQSSSSVEFDGSEKPLGERNVDQSVVFGVTRNTYSAHSKFSEITQAEKVVDRSGKPVGEKNIDQSIGLVSRETRTVPTASFLKSPKLRKWSIDQGNLWEKAVQTHRLRPCLMNRDK